MKLLLVLAALASGCDDRVYVCESEAVIVKPADILWVESQIDERLVRIGFHIEDREADGTPVVGGGVHVMRRSTFERMSKR